MGAPPVNRGPSPLGDKLVTGDGFVSIRKAIPGAIPGGGGTVVLERIGAHMVGVTQDGFKQQGRSRKWRPRRVPNIAGIIDDLNEGGSIKQRRGKPKPVLVDTGRLRSSITYKLAGAKAVVFGTNVPYAKVHQEGGYSRMRVTNKAQRSLKALRDRAGRRENPDSVLPSGVTWADIGFLYVQKTVRIRIIPRPFLEVTAQDRDDIVAIIEDFFREQTKK